jgi:hypothetical protein
MREKVKDNVPRPSSPTLVVRGNGCASLLGRDFTRGELVNSDLNRLEESRGSWTQGIRKSGALASLEVDWMSSAILVIAA